MTRTIAIAPVRKSVRVEASQQRAFDVFTAGLGRWWPRNMGISRKPMRMAVLEPRPGGRWYELCEDGTETTVGRLLVWEPPNRLVVSWEINSRWQSDPDAGSEVEIVFTPDGPGATRVDLEHRNFETLGDEAGASLRKDVDGGWPGLLDLFKQTADAPS